MKVKVDQFCSLATSPSWQAWLFKFEQSIYRKFVKKLQESRGCNQNRDLMTETLLEVEKSGGNDNLVAFLKENYPHMLMADNGEPVKSVTPKDGDDIFEHYNPAILTYPRRMVLTGDNLQKRVRSFVLDKLKHDSVIVGDKAYIEYLDKSDKAFAEQIPPKNWRIAAWRLRSSQT